MSKTTFTIRLRLIGFSLFCDPVVDYSEPDLKHEPATQGSAVANAHAMQESDAEYSAAMWAGCALMAMHVDRSDVFSEHAERWAKKLGSLTLQ